MPKLPQPDAYQIEEQAITDTAVSIDEQLAQLDPTPPVVTEDEKSALAGQIWLDNGGIPDDPRTLNNWLQAEAVLVSGKR